MSCGVGYNDLKKEDLPDIKTPHYRKMMRSCMVNFACKESHVFQVEQNRRKKVLTGFGVTAISFVALALFVGMPDFGFSHKISQAHAQSIVEDVVPTSSPKANQYLNRALVAEDSHIVSPRKSPRWTPHNNMALSSAVSYAVSSQSARVSRPVDFRINMLPGYMTGTEIRTIEFTGADGEHIQLGVNAGNVSFVRVQQAFVPE